MEAVESKVFTCAECGKEFASRASLHKHFKQHDLNLASYYTKHFPRKNKLTGDPLPFKRYEEYFERDFSTKQQLLKWCEENSLEEVKKYAMSLLEKRHNKKNRKYGAFHLETKNSFLVHDRDRNIKKSPNIRDEYEFLIKVLIFKKSTTSQKVIVF